MLWSLLSLIVIAVEDCFLYSHVHIMNVEEF